jgi:Asp-tRNA(Asn)/Glu-tRNA(Gln) amidotransferase A subunit family amidase
MDRPALPVGADAEDVAAGEVTAAANPISRRGVLGRGVLGLLTVAGVGTPVFRRALAAQAEEGAAFTAEMIQQAEWIAGIKLSEQDREATLRTVRDRNEKLAALRSAQIGYADPPALWFNPTPGRLSEGEVRRGAVPANAQADVARPADDNDLAFLSVAELASLLRTRRISAVELTRLYLDRLHKHDATLKCVVSFTDELALRQAEQADREIAAGRYRGPLHGIPWGAKDIISYPGYRTTWGAVPFEQQQLEVKATVAERLDEAGAVLIAKLSVGALALGDKWFGGMTRNPWNTEQGSSGSSAGSAAATVAGLVGFALGSETLGSIVSPCRRCRVTGLRPTFGRVSRFGCMSLCWSMDKIGPICRTVEDCALVLDVIHGADGRDPTAVDRPFDWPARRELSSLRVGYFPEKERPDAERAELNRFKELGVQLVPIELPRTLPVDSLDTILVTEAAAVFDELTRQGRLEGIGPWPNTFRAGQFIPAIEYLRANRVRGLLMRQMEQLMQTVDAYIGGDDLMITNFTGHPTVVLPKAAESSDGVETPSMMTMTGRLYGESDLLSLAHAFQQGGGFHKLRPRL